MVKVQKIIVEEFNFHKELKNQKNKDFQKCLELVPDLKNYLTDKSKLTVSFELIQTNTDLANAIRRCLISEIEVLSFDFDEYKDLDVTDMFILSDFIKKQMDLLPINQEIELLDYSISLFKENKTDGIIDVLSDNITVLYKNKKVTDLVSKNIILARLRPGKYIKINNIKIVKGIAKNHSAKFNSISNIRYKILDVDPIVETREGTSGVSSMISNPTHFSISYSTHRNISKPLKLVVECCDTLEKRLKNIQEEMKNISNKAEYYYSPLIELESSGSLKKIQIKGEYWTIVNLICRFCFILTQENIKFISPALIHPEKEIGVINISHPEFSTLIQDAIKKIILELLIIKESFQ